MNAAALAGAGFYAISFAWGLASLAAPRRVPAAGMTLSAWGGFLWTTGLLLSTALADGRFPAGSLAETLLCLVWLLSGIALAACRGESRSFLIFAMPLAALLSAAAFFTAERSWEPGGAVLALHGGASVLGYAAFAASFTTGVMYLVEERALRARGGLSLVASMPSLAALDRWNARATAWGFPFLTLAVATGLLQARERWGAGWSGDPIVIGVLATWTLYAALLVCRHGLGLRGRRISLLAVAAFGLGLSSLLAGFLLGGNH